MDGHATQAAVSLNPPHREQFLRLLDRELAECQLSEDLVGLLVIHLSGVGRINLELGYAAGDALLALTAQRIREAVRPIDLLLRIDGVDFALIMPNLKNVGQVLLAARKIGSVCAQSCLVQGQLVTTRPCIGAALAPEHATTAESLLRCADEALARAEGTVDGLHVYEAPAAPRGQGSLTLECDLEAALDNNDLEAYFQPQIDLGTGRFVGVETLSRWCHRERGFMRPDVFVAAAERSGLIDPLTQWNLNAAVRTQQMRFPEFSVAVNLSAVTLKQPDIADMIEQVIEIWGIDPAQLVLEVTESALIADPHRTLTTLHRLDEKGVRLSIDDFGTGYSSLTYLSELPVTELKIDQSFVMNMIEHRQSQQIVQAVVDLAHNLELSVVAEGIENRATLDARRTMGCDMGQGYYFARPLPVAELGKWLSSSPWAGAQDSAEFEDACPV